MPSTEYDIVVANDEWDKWWEYVNLCPTEVACFGYCTPTDDGRLFVDELFLVPQIVSPSQVDFMTDGLPFALKKAIADDRVNDLRFCVHSHVNMGAFWSGTDEDMIESMGSTGTPWFASAVTNKKHEAKARVDMYRNGLPLPGMKQATVVADIYPEGHDTLREQFIEELEEHLVRAKPPVKKGPKQLSPPSTNKNKGKTASEIRNEEIAAKAKAAQCGDVIEYSDGSLYGVGANGMLVPLEDMDNDNDNRPDGPADYDEYVFGTPAEDIVGTDEWWNQVWPESMRAN